MPRKPKASNGPPGDPVMFHFEPLLLTREEIMALAERYWTYGERYRRTEEEIVERIAPEARRRGSFERDEFLKICMWKSPRPAKHYRKNTAEEVKRATSAAFSASDPETCVRALLDLHGVGLPVASVLLHFGHRDDYSILDVFALKALERAVPTTKTASMGFWRAYVEHSRGLAMQYGVDMRTLDRALWTRGKELARSTHQKRTEG